MIIGKANDGFRRFFELESAGGLILISTALLALLFSNSPLSSVYSGVLDLPLEVRIGSFFLGKPLLLWINDGLMAIFFLLVGLEIKREVLEGELSSPSRILLPLVSAIGGVVAPALIFFCFNRGDPTALNGWAIPTATDIAFALGILALLGSRIPLSLKIFLTAVAIADDLGAIIIIALFYTSDLSVVMLLFAAAAIAVLATLNWLDIARIAPYAIVGLFLWILVLKSGVHATLAGVVVAFAIPLRIADSSGASPLHRLEHGLHPWVAFAVLPLFAFANAGVSLDGVTLSTLASPVPLGIAAGLVVGKLIGVFGAAAALILLGFAKLPEDSNWVQLMGVAILCGIGFTMSLFIGSLAFEAEPSYLTHVRLGVITGSVICGVLGYLVLRFAPSQSPAKAVRAS
ncbi:MAG: Na+/H+ antiporter NhaA [Burkholderiales bacterium]